jgi:hypothetical protein
MSIRHWLETESISKSIIRRINGIVCYTVLLLGFISKSTFFVNLLQQAAIIS